MSVTEQPISGNGSNRMAERNGGNCRTATEERIRNGYVRMETRHYLLTATDRSSFRDGQFCECIVSSAALMQKYEIGLYLLTAARALIVVL